MYDKLDELISLVRALDTKMNFLMEDVEALKEDMIQVKFLLDNPEEKEPTKEQAEKRWKVETF
jgi:outer membrane murein-binding lipoprotein Lpp